MRLPKPRLTHEEKMAELRAKMKEESDLLEILARANVGKEELIELLGERANTKEEELAASAARIAAAQTAAVVRVRAEEIIAKLRLDQLEREGDGFVYFVETLDREHLKIGYSEQPQKRLMQLGKVSWKKINVIGHIRGTLELEHALHVEFAAHRINGEWFELSPLLKEFLRLVYLVSPELRRNAFGYRHRNWK